MPARSVVIEKLSKFTGEHHEFLTPGEYTQLTGRAGRRGIDERGYAVVLLEPVRALRPGRRRSRRGARTRCTSSFRPTYNMAANLVRRYPKFEAHHLLNLSFAQYHADRDVVTLERQLDRTRQQLARQRELVGSRRRATSRSTARSLAELDTLRRNRGGGRRIAEAMEALRPGDVVVVAPPRRAGRGAEPRAPAGRRQPPGRGHTGSRRRAPRPPGLRRAAPPRRHHRSPDAVRAPQPGVPPPGRRSAAPGEAPRRRRTYAPRGTAPGRARGRARRAPAAAATRNASRSCGPPPRSSASSATCSAPSDGCGAAARASPASSTACSRVLEAWGYVDGWQLTDAGEQLARLYTETDLLLAEALREGLLDGLRPPELAAVVSLLHLRASRARRAAPDAAGALAHQDGGQAGARRRAALARTCGPTRTTPGCPRPGRPTPASRPTSTTGRRATRSPTCSTTTR